MSCLHVGRGPSRSLQHQYLNKYSSESWMTAICRDESCENFVASLEFWKPPQKRNCYPVARPKIHRPFPPEVVPSPRRCHCNTHLLGRLEIEFRFLCPLSTLMGQVYQRHQALAINGKAERGLGKKYMQI